MGEMTKKKQTLYDLPFEYRIRIKYMTFGLLLGISGLAFLVVVPDITIRVLSYAFPQSITYDNHNHIGLMLPFLLFIPLVYFLWYSKAKPKSHPELDETVGLKTDYDRVKGI